MTSEKKILIVEDDPYVAEDLRIKLDYLGYVVCEIARSGPDAVRLAEQTCPDLVLMDIVLPGELDGIQAAEQIHQRMGTPVVYLTAYSNDQLLARAKLTEPSGFLIKPCDERELQASLSVALYKAYAQQRLYRNAQLAAALVRLGEPLLCVDSKGRITLANEAASDLLCRQRQQILGAHILEILRLREAGTGKSLTGDLLVRLEADGQIERTDEIELERDDGALLSIVLSGSQIRDPKTHAAEYVFLMRDVTQGAQTAQRLRQAQNDPLTA